MLNDKTYPKFHQKKQKILAALSAPSESYTDLSPKGSIDIGIKDLIDKLNQSDGIVTTSSCAGRISVFLEGTKGTHLESSDGIDGIESQKAVPGGKGRGGRWLFVSHDPVQAPAKNGPGDRPISRLFGLSQQRQISSHLDTSQIRFVRFQFEPMILHIMTASLHHAEPVLSAAISAGFRESGIQSLKNIREPDSCPMVAVRSSGLALESLIGMVVGHELEEEVSAIVDEEYLGIILSLANQRFVSNAERIRRFFGNLFQREIEARTILEDTMTRKERKRAEGLRRKELLQEQEPTRETDSIYELYGTQLSDPL